jgi:phage baseplate assembly protein W
MRREILGRGWKFPVQVDARGRIAVSEADEDIREAIRIILGTVRGERVMRPEFGCGIYNYMYAQVNTGNLALIENAVREALETWEPRIDVLTVKADPSAAADGKLLVRIDYRVRSTNTQFNLVYPFYLKEGW